jgi:hypothetical protein
MTLLSRSIAVAAVLTASATLAHADTYQITVENLLGGGGPDTGQPLSPPVAVVHGAGYTLWAPGGTATPGLELQAEDGDPSGIAGEAEAAADVSAVVVGAGPFFDVEVVMIEGEPGDLFSLSSMLGRTNDIITGVNNVALPDTEVVIMTSAWDAGTEENTGLIAHIPFYGNPGVGPDEKGVITEILEYSVVDDPDHGKLTWTFPPAARITITRMDASPTRTGTWSSLKGLY